MKAWLEHLKGNFLFTTETQHILDNTKKETSVNQIMTK